MKAHEKPSWQPTPRPPARLFIILAREAQRAIIFRRGPSGWVRLILWHTDTDLFEYGQWFKGRIYERRCDLSPDGTKLIYFAQKINKRTIQDKEYTYAWTAISKPPYLTALALWPKGDCWHGGGLFEGNKTVLLNHRPAVAKPHPDHLPKGLVVTPNSEAQGEDDPIYGMRLSRYGWSVQQEWQAQRKPKWRGLQLGYKTKHAEIRVRQHPSHPYRIELTRSVNQLQYHETFSVLTSESERIIETRNAQWVDWDNTGRLVLLREGKVFVADARAPAISLHELADFNAQEPESIAAPDWATTW